ncbi:MAG: GntR family transcriptional regulator [Lachnospiraceae bacterium]|jgi:GntR family transcriptional regulator|nr:GntR family transcriptional regulator [Lachnospiraceae bacterium]
MPWTLNSERPIYAQIVEKIQMDIISGVYAPGDRLPSVRELAAEASVNPNTMQKALTELERTELVYSVRTSGRFITEDTALITQVKEELAAGQAMDFLEKMTQLGFQTEDIFRLIEKLTQAQPQPEKEREK